MNYLIIVDNLNININKLDTNEYEFITTFEYLDYYGKSFLKNLNFIDDLHLCAFKTPISKVFYLISRI